MAPRHAAGPVFAGGALALAVGSLALLLSAVPAAAERGEAAVGGDDAAPAAGARGEGHGRRRVSLPRGWRSTMPPTSPDETDDPDVAEAIRSAPPAPPPAAPYVGGDQAIKAARAISRRVPGFPPFRSAIALGTWRVDESQLWRIRPGAECRAQLAELGVRARPFEPDPADPVDTEPTPTPVVIKGRIGGVYFAGWQGDLVVSCELAARLPVLARVLAEHDVDRVMIASSWRPEPRTSLHTLGMGLDIPTLWTKTALVGPDGGVSKRLSLKTDFLETPDRPTCDPALFEDGSPLGGNERGRRLLSIACKLHETGVFASVLTPNYNAGHRDHFHVDIRPDDPRAFIR